MIGYYGGDWWDRHRRRGVGFTFMAACPPQVLGRLRLFGRDGVTRCFTLDWRRLNH